MTDQTYIKDRIKSLMKMDNYVRNVVGDEDEIEFWLTYGVPDEATEEMLDYIANNSKEYANMKVTFAEIILRTI